MKYELWGYEENISQDKIGGPFIKHGKWELVAVFTTLEKAESYIKKSRLKNIKKSWSGDQVFKNNSILRNHQDCEIREFIEPVIDPEI